MRFFYSTFLSLFLVSTALAGGYTRGAGARRPAVHYPFSNSGTLDTSTRGATTHMWIDFSQDPSGVTITSSDGGFVFTKAGSPVRVHDGTWPEGFSGTEGYAHRFNGTDAYWYRTGDGAFDPAGSFSVQCVITPQQVATTATIISKYGSAGNRSWMIYHPDQRLFFCMTEDGTVADCNGTANFLLAGKPMFFTHTYQYVGSGTSISTFYVDNNAADVYSTLDGPVHASGAGADFEIGSSVGGTNKFQGLVQNCVYYDGIVLTKAVHDRDYARWRGAAPVMGPVMITAAPNMPALELTPTDSGTEPVFVGMPADTIMVMVVSSGVGGLYSASALNNEVRRGKFRTCTQNGNTEPDGWTVSETAGDGSADIACSTASVLHDRNSALFTLTGTTSHAELTSTCVDVDETKDHFLEVWTKKTSGTVDVEIRVYSYSDSGCTTDEVEELVLDEGNVSSDWGEIGPELDGLIAAADWAGTANYAQLEIKANSGAAGAFLVAGPQLAKNAATPNNGLCVCDTDSICACDHVINQVVSAPIGSRTWQIRATVQSPFAFANSVKRYIFSSPGTGGNANRIDFFIQTGNLYLDIYDSGAVRARAQVTCDAPAETDVEVMGYHTAQGLVGVCCDGVCDLTPATGCILSTIGDCYIENTSNTAFDTLVGGLKFFGRVYQ